MKKLSALVLGLIFLLSAACADTSVFETIAGNEWSFSSGVGGWSTELYIREDGSFTGNFHDGERGDSGDEYPEGTIYICTFSGQMSLAEQVDDNTWKIHIDSVATDPVTEIIEDGVRFMPASPYGITEGATMLLYGPGTPVSALSEEMRFWAHVQDHETPPAELDCWFLTAENGEAGFVGYPPVSIANPWEDMTAEQLKEASGLVFGVPEGAENVIYRYLRTENLAEMQFTIDGDEFCARIMPAALEEGQLMNIAGMYFSWENEEPVSIGNGYGTIGQAQTGTTDFVELCQWYVADRGLMYSLSVYTTEPDGLDLTAVAEQVYIPAE